MEGKRYRELENGVRQAFRRSNGLMKSSMRYDFLGEEDGVNRYIRHVDVPKRDVLGGKATIEILQNPKTREIEHIYIVA